jgi:hypothetical protein
MKTPVRVLAALVSTACFVAGMGVAPANAGGPILTSTKKLVVKDSTDPAKYAVKIVAKDAAIVTTDYNPVASGLHLNIGSVDRNVNSNSVFMAQAGWKAVSKGFLYSDKDGASGPVLKVKFLAGKLVIKAKGAGFNFALLGQPQSGSMAFDVYGGQDLCGLVPGADGLVKKDDPEKGIYVGIKGEAPPTCPSVVYD